MHSALCLCPSGHTCLSVVPPRAEGKASARPASGGPSPSSHEGRGGLARAATGAAQGSAGGPGRRQAAASRARLDDLPGAARRSGLGGAPLPSPLALAAGRAAPRRPAGRPQAGAQNPKRAQPGPGEAADSAKAGHRPARQATGQRTRPAPRHAAPAAARRARPHLEGTRSAATAGSRVEGGFPIYAARWICARPRRLRFAGLAGSGLDQADALGDQRQDIRETPCRRNG